MDSRQHHDPSLPSLPLHQPNLHWRPFSRGGYSLVFLLIIISFVVTAGGPEGPLTRLVATIFQGLTIVSALRASYVKPYVLRLGWLAFVVSGTISLIAVFTVLHISGFIFLLNCLLLAATSITIVRHLATILRPITVQTVYGALCVYLLSGMFFAYLDASVGDFIAKPFFNSGGHATISSYLYFSFTTLTTVGYGDLAPIGDLPRTLAMVEALFGQLYLVTIVALLIGNFGQRHPLQDE